MIEKYKLFSVGLLLAMISGGHAFGQDTTSTIPNPPAELVSKKGYPILPKGGDFGLGIDVLPFLRYARNFLSDATASNTVYRSGQQIMGKYFLGRSDQSYSSLMAIRGKLRVANFDSYSKHTQILDNQPISDPSVVVQDQRTDELFFVGIGGGLEWRRGSGRFYGIYGGELNFQYGKGSALFEYGNPYSINNQTPTSTTFIEGAGTGERAASINGRKNVGIGTSAFAGVEYFVAPRISLNAELIYGVWFNRAMKGSTDFEGWDSLKNTTYTRTTPAPGSNGFTGNLGGSINAMFYF